MDMKFGFQFEDIKPFLKEDFEFFMQFYEIFEKMKMSMFFDNAMIAFIFHHRKNIIDKKQPQGVAKMFKYALN